MKKRHSLLILIAVGLILPLAASNIWFSSAPATANEGEPYYIEATAVDFGWGWNDWGEVYLFKNGSTVASNSGYSYVWTGTWQADAGSQTIEYYAEAYGNDSGGAAWHYITIIAQPPVNQPPFGVRDYHHNIVSKNGNLYASGWAVDPDIGAPISRVDILIDGNDVGDANLGGYRPDVADAYGRSDYTYSGWSFNYNVGGLSVGTHSLQLVAWDNQGASTPFGNATFDVIVNVPNITLLSPSGQTIALGTTLTLSSRATDADGDIVTHNLEIQRPDGTWNWGGGFAYGEPYMGGPVGSGADSTRSASFTFGLVGTWYVRSWVCDASSNNLHSATVAITVVDNSPPSVPTGLFSSAVTSETFTLNWTASSDNVSVAAYEVFKAGVSQGTTGATSFSLSGFTPSTTVSVSVRAMDSSGNWSAQSSPLNVTTAPDSVAPSIPGGLYSSAVAMNSFTLNWSTSSDNVGVTEYEVFRNGASLGSSAGVSRSITGLAPSTAYAMTVRARDPAGNWSAQSAALSVTTAVDSVAPSVPTGLNGSAITMYSYTLSWSASSDNVGVTAYEVFRNGTSLGTVSGVSCSVTGLAPGTTYAMAVRARDAVGNWSAQSGAANVSTIADTTAPAAPSDLGYTSLTSSSFTLTWSAPTENVGVTAYEIKRDSTVLAQQLGTSVNVSGLSGSTTYSMTVRARDAAGNWSAWSSPLGVTTLFTDTDSDGLPDSWEQQYTGTLQYAGNQDLFGVGRTLLQSYQQSLSPLPTATVSNGLQAWFRADLGVTKDASNNVSQWLDASGRGFHLRQSTAASQPLWINEGANSQPAIDFNGGENLKSDVNALQGGNSDLTVIAVVIPNSAQPSSQPVMVDFDGDGASGFSVRQATTGYALRWRNQAQTTWEGQSAPLVSLTATTAQYITFIKSGTTQTAYKNGAIQASAVVSSTMLTPTAAFGLGASVSTGTSYYNGMILEVLVYNRALSATERQQVETYFAGKFGIVNPDSDGDGLPDAWETQYFGSLINGANADYDGDGLTNLQEYQTGLDPTYRLDGISLPSEAQLVLRTPVLNFFGVNTSTWTITKLATP